MNGKHSKIGRVLDRFGDVLMYAAVVAGLFFLVTHFLLGWSINPVLGEGMGPALGRGALAVVIDVDPQDVAVDDTIVYYSPLSGEITAHRVIKIHVLDGQPLFRTQGDNNESPDPYLVPGENIIGFVGLTIPGLGYLVSFGQSPLGFVFLLGIPGLVVTGVQTRELVFAIERQKIRRRARWTTGLSAKDWLR